MGPPSSVKISRVPTYLFLSLVRFRFIRNKGLSPTMADLSRTFYLNLNYYHLKADPISLAATIGISFDFFSSGYLDVSVHQVLL